MTTQASGPVVATATFEILAPGIQTTVQDHPGRVGLQSKGFFPSGAMDHFALRAANALVGNPPGAAGLEIPMGRFRCRFDAVTTIAVCGADGAPAQLDGVDVPMWQTVRVPAGGVLAIGVAKGPGFRLYVAVAGGVAVPEVMGSRATYTMGALGGLDGRALRKGDVLPIGTAGDGPPRRLPERQRPKYTHDWTVEVMRGPQADPDYLTPGDWALFVGQQWKVDLNSNRVGIRLRGDKFTWARSSGGVAGGHPSNILDDSYPLGGINVNGDVPVILGPDGPTSGGFVCIATVVHPAFWKVGQFRPGRDSIRFTEVTADEASALRADLNRRLDPATWEEP